jgi:GTP diphosphokinase / guanosine-3',5'-bis(diphosphate) 3'-diphosphatase
MNAEAVCGVSLHVPHSMRTIVTSSYDAMLFAREVHQNHRRKYTGRPYFHHLAEVAGIAMTACPSTLHNLVAQVSWLHDCIEDQGVSHATLTKRFGVAVADGVQLLSDMEQGNRAQRKAASRDRLGAAPDWVQTIKCADLISNTSSIVQHDPGFAGVYLAEAQALLSVLTRADQRLLALTNDQVQEGLRALRDHS